MADLVNRMIRAAKLDASLYKEVETDPSALSQAAIVVVISSVAAGIGSITSGGIRGLIGGIIVSLVGWVILVGVTYLLGTKVFPEPETKADFSGMLRSLGFARAPGVLTVFAIIPFLGWLIMIVAAVWGLVAAVVAVKTTLDYQSTLRAVGVCLLGAIAAAIPMFIVVGLFVGASVAAG